MKAVKKLLFLLLFTVFMVSCKDDGYSLDYYWIDIATVENTGQRSAFYFRLDDNTLMFTAASNFYNYYRPKDGQRIIANYTILNDKPEGSAYDHDVRLNDVFEVLTKEVYSITPETEDSIGNDPINIVDMWIGNDYLNVEFEFKGLNKVHFINLVSDANKTYTDGKVHLEFRHNAYGDMPSYRRRGIVSFNLKSLQEGVSGVDKLDLVIHVKESDSVEKTYQQTYKFADTGSAKYRTKEKLDIKRFQAKID
ncbi:hypothetical protein D0T49_10930 [Paludibacter sp. 221]|uniref:NigD-like protein n=1 Tax=Paludibacter sp. 221 TaxID=2302939 RepID=UPI0013D42B95|nr:NigD-like protein [Paludibacter sp. 221]NDV47561.1 hypothetical protein [Paludibacter sp. 221]